MATEVEVGAMLSGVCLRAFALVLPSAQNALLTWPSHHVIAFLRECSLFSPPPVLLFLSSSVYYYLTLCYFNSVQHTLVHPFVCVHTRQ